MKPVVSMKNVSKRYDRFALENVSLMVPRGYLTGIIGPNGSGKTTLFRLMLDLIHPDQGKITLFGKQLAGNEKMIKSRIGFLFAQTEFYGNQTINGMKKMIAPFYDSWNEATFQGYLERFGLHPETKIKKLSQGMTMKFSLALALSHDAELLLLDEPTSGLDPVFRRELMDIFGEILQDETKTIVMATHNTRELDERADFIIYIDRGKIIFNRAKDDLFQQYALVKGPRGLLEDDRKETLIGMRQTEVGFHGLTDQVFQWEALSSDHSLVIEKPTLEDILYYFQMEKRP